MPFSDVSQVPDIANAILETMPVAKFPYLVEMATEYVLQPGYDFGKEFAFGLDLLLSALEQHQSAMS